jgi:carboxymethylenebutenolidase
MCFEYYASPPELPPGAARMSGGAAAEELVLTSGDGTEFAAALAQSAEAGGTAVVVLPDVRGLYRFYVELAERLAQAGHPAIAFDYFGRTAGAGPRDEDFEFGPHVEQTTAQTVQLDLVAARSALAERTGAESFATLGFCFGGTHSLYAGTNLALGLDRVIGFYGLLDPQRAGKANRPSLLEHADEIRVPVLGLSEVRTNRFLPRTSRPSIVHSRLRGCPTK